MVSFDSCFQFFEIHFTSWKRLTFVKLLRITETIQRSKEQNYIWNDLYETKFSSTFISLIGIEGVDSFP